MTSNGRESRKGIEKGGTILLTSNVGGSKKGIEKGGTILLTSNVRGSRKGIEKEGAILLMSSVRGSTRETEKGKISLKSNWRMNDREQEKIDAELATSSEKESEKQQGETGKTRQAHQKSYSIMLTDIFSICLVRGKPKVILTVQLM